MALNLYRIRRRHSLAIPCLMVLAGCAYLPASPSPQETAENSCLKCHNPIAVALQKKFKHAAVEMGCDSCHVDHRAPATAAPSQKAASYLKAGQPGVCLECHEAKDLEKPHSGQPFASSQCSGCHDPHSSNSPKLVPEVSHGPYGARECSGCHAAPEGGKVKLNSASANELCYSCHDDLKTRIEGAKSRHKLLSMSGRSCVECHDPHASNQKASLKKPVQALCITCHLDLTAGKKYVHEPVGVSCTYCHDAHASNFPKNLQAATQDLCLGCHGANGAKILLSTKPFPLFEGRVNLPPKPFENLPYLDLSADGKKGHPILGHPISAPATAEKPELGCLTCHVPHAAASGKQLLVKDKGSLCMDCHKM